MNGRKAKLIRKSVKKWQIASYEDRVNVSIQRWRSVADDEPMYNEITANGAKARIKTNYQSLSPQKLADCGRRDYKRAKKFFT